MSQPDLRALSRAPIDPSASFTVPRPASRWRTRVLLPALILLTGAGVVAYAARDVLRPGTPVKAVPVIPKAAGALGAPGERPGGVIVQAPGWVEPDPFAITVPALAEGVVRELLVLEGQTVAAGDVVARLVDDDSRLELRAAEAVLATREAEVEEARAAIATAEAQVGVENALAGELRDEVERKRSLVGGGVAAGDFRRLELRLDAAVATVGAAERVVAERRAALKRAEAALGEAGVARDEADLRLERMTVTTSVAGVVLARLVAPGSRVGGLPRPTESGTLMEPSVVRVYNPAHLQVRVDVPLADAAKVGVGSVATVSTEALPDAAIRGVVTRVVQEANIQRNTVQFKVRLEEPPALLKPEMLTRVKFHAGHGVGGDAGMPGGDGAGGAGGAGDSLLLIPTDALVNPAEGRAHVWVVEAAGGRTTVASREITTSPAGDEGFVIVRTGLRPTDKVVVRPPAELKPGQRVIPEGTP